MIVDGGSKDGTVEKVEDYAETNTDILIQVVKGTKGKQINQHKKTSLIEHLYHQSNS